VTAAALALASGASAQTFIGQNFTASRSDVELLRPDVSGAAGTDYFVELSGGRYSVYRKSDGVRVQSSNIETFWADAGAQHSGDRAYDPRVLYDPYARRWYALSADNFNPAIGAADPNSFLFAVSRSSNPTAGWTGFKIDSDSNDDHWADLPTIGFNKDVVTLAANMYNLGTSNPPATPTFVVIPKSGLLGPAPTVAGASKFEELNISTTGFAVQPAVDLDNGPLPLPLLARFNLASLKRSNVTGTPASPSINVSGGSIPISSNLDPPTADQPGNKVNIWTGGDTRIWSSVVRNNGELWAVQTVGLGGRAAVRWYRVNESTNAIIESGYISDPSMAYFFPSIAVNDLGDVVIGMNGTDPNTYVSALAVVGKTAGPGAGTTTFGPPLVTKAGVSDYQILDGAGRNRWGDYSATANDPADPSIFWTIQAYVYKTDARATQVSEIIIPQPNEARWKDPAGGDFDVNTNWLGGSAPGAASHAVFSRATDPAGSGYIVNVPSSVSLDRLSVRQGKVTLNLNGAVVAATNTSLATPSIAVGEFGGAPTLNIVDGTVAGVHATLAASPISSANVNLNHARLGLEGNLSVGGTDSAPGGEAVINIDAESSVGVGQTLRVWDGGVVNFNQGTLSTGPLIVHGGRVKVAAAGGLKIVRATDVQTTGGGRIDLTTNAMVVDYEPGNSPLATVKSALASGYDGGTWAGPGIVTSAGGGALGYAESMDLLGPDGGDFLGQAVDRDAVLVRYTLSGDANLNGAVGFEDLVALAQNYNTVDGSAVWMKGDFTYDGNVDFTDLVALAQNYNTSMPSAAQLEAIGAGAAFAEDVAAAFAQVPEPGPIALVALVAGLAIRRRAGGHRRTS
jgi:hypothetical protein